MNRDEASIYAKYAKEIEAFANGKTIEYYDEFGREWLIASSPRFLEGTKYRIKPEPKLTPFAFNDAEKLIGKAVKSKSYGTIHIVTDIHEAYLYFSTICVSYKELLVEYTFLDGSPCGKETI